jgi:ribose transport system ATP-binding protein
VTRDLAGLDTATMIRLMVGRDLADEYPAKDPEAVLGAELVRAEGLTPPGGRPVSFAVRAGEIVGVAGLVGAGRTEAVRALFGADRPRAGAVYVRGERVRIRSPRDAVRRRIGLLTEDRKAQGIVPSLSVAANTTLVATGRVSRLGLLRKGTEHELAAEMGARLRTKAANTGVPVRTLSGGNQQKVLLGRWLLADSDVLVVDEPTRGIDVGARFEIHQLLVDLAAQGKGLLVVSSDLPELMGICDRILVFSRGAIAGEVERSQFDSTRILELAYSGYIADPISDPAAAPPPVAVEPSTEPITGGTS